MSVVDPEFDFPFDQMTPLPPVDPLQELQTATRQVFIEYATGDHARTSAAILRVLQLLHGLP